MAPPPQNDRGHSPNPAERVPPGAFVNGQMREECARFLDEVRSLVHRRAEQKRHLPAQRL